MAHEGRRAGSPAERRMTLPAQPPSSTAVCAMPAQPSPTFGPSAPLSRRERGRLRRMVDAAGAPRSTGTPTLAVSAVESSRSTPAAASVLTPPAAAPAPTAAASTARALVSTLRLPSHQPRGRASALSLQSTGRSRRTTRPSPASVWSASSPACSSTSKSHQTRSTSGSASGMPTSTCSPRPCAVRLAEPR